MPWHIQRQGKKFLVVKGHSGEKGAVVGTHPSKEKATKHLRALYAIEGDGGNAA